MRYKATFLVGLGAGYVLGTKAGRQRYEQIKAKAREFMGLPAVQESMGLVEGKAERLVDTAKNLVADKLGGRQLQPDLPTFAGAAPRDPYPT